MPAVWLARARVPGGLLAGRMSHAGAGTRCKCFRAEVRFTGTTGGPPWAAAIPGPRSPSPQGPWGARRLGTREATEPAPPPTRPALQ